MGRPRRMRRGAPVAVEEGVVVVVAVGRPPPLKVLPCTTSPLSSRPHSHHVPTLITSPTLASRPYARSLAAGTASILRRAAEAGWPDSRGRLSPNGADRAGPAP